MSGHSIIDLINVDYNIMGSDHFPLSVHIACGNINLSTDLNTYTKQSIKWSSLNDQDIYDYKCNTARGLTSVTVPVDVICCKDLNCSNSSHKASLDSFYGDIISTLSLCSLPYIKRCKNNNYNIPGWNDYCKEAHDQARDSFKLWCAVADPGFEVWGAHFLGIRFAPPLERLS